MDKNQLTLIVGADKANKWYEAIVSAMAKFSINTPLRQSHFLAQILHESGGLTRTEENLNYSAERLAAVWPARYNDARLACPNQLAKALAHNPQQIGNSIYGGRMGNNSANDGYTYRGRGLIQLTGKGNYQDFSAYMKDESIVDDPDIVSHPILASMSAAWFWSTKGCNQMADIDDVVNITKRINGGLNGLEERKKMLAKVKKVMGI